MLAGEAQGQVFTLMQGGTREPGAAQTFTVKDRPYPYRWMGSDLDTKAEYIAYLERVYTPEQAAAYWEKQTGSGSIVELDGRLAQPDTDGGSVIDWTQAKGVFVEDGADRKTFRLTVVNENIGSETRDLHMRYVDGKGWRVDDPVGTFR